MLYAIVKIETFQSHLIFFIKLVIIKTEFAFLVVGITIESPCKVYKHCSSSSTSIEAMRDMNMNSILCHLLILMTLLML